jgi:hypothetical protein
MRLALAVCCAASVIVAGCGGSSATEEAAPAAPPVSIGRPTTTTTAAATTVAETTTTTVAPTTTTLDPAEQAKAEIAQDYAELFALRAELSVNPNATDRDARLAQFHDPSGGMYAESLELFGRMAADGRTTLALDPAFPFESGTLESIELVGEPPYASAYVWHCMTFNFQEALAADGVPIEGTQGTWAIRLRWDVVASEQGWRFEVIGANPNEYWNGATECPS